MKKKTGKKKNIDEWRFDIQEERQPIGYKGEASEPNIEL